MTLLNVKKTSEEADKSNNATNAVDEFSMENLDLNALDEELLSLNNVNDSNRDDKKPDQPTDSFSLDTVDLNPPPSPNDHTKNTDDFDFESLNQAFGSSSTNAKNSTPQTQDFDINTLNTNSPTIDHIPNLAAPIASSNSLFGKKEKPTKKSLFGKKTNKTGGNTPPMDNKKKMLILVALFVALLLLIGLIFKQFSQINAIHNQSQPTSTTDNPPEMVDTPITETPEVAMPVTEETNAPATTPEEVTVHAQNIIKAEDILKPEIPKDTAIAQEELDRLADQAKQLKEQEALIESQLQTMKELSSKKDERIALLEQQIAQLEQQKAGSQ